MSRNPHEPTDALRRQVRGLAGVGLPHDDIAIIVECSPKTLRLYYRAELDDGAADANAAMVQALLRKIEDGNIPAMIFFEKCKGGKREVIKEEISVASVVSAKFQTELDGIAKRYPNYEEGPVTYMGLVFIAPRCPQRECDQMIERELRIELGIKAGLFPVDVDHETSVISREIERRKADGKRKWICAFWRRPK